MGQYYTAVILDEDGQLEHVGGGFGKLLDSGWLNNKQVTAFESLLALESPVRVVWAGDYADAEKNPDGTDLVVKSDMYTAGEGPGNLYVLARTFKNAKRTPGRRIKVTTTSRPYLINWDKRLYVDKRLVEDEPGESNIGWKLHPLPLLTVDGNGRGGGDFTGPDPEGLVGSWARDHLSVSKHIPDGDFTEIKFNLHDA